MADIVNLRRARKEANRRKDDEHAAAQRLAHGLRKDVRRESQAKRDKATRDLEQHRIQTGDGE